jgi:ribonuclease HI
MFTDGACKGNPGPGGWGVLIRMGEREKELSGGREPDHQQPDGADGGDPRA